MNFMQIVVAASIMLERYTHWIMRSIVVLFCVQYLGMQDKNAYHIITMYTTIIYSIPIFVTYFIDKFVGIKSVVTAGIKMIVLGQLFFILSFLYAPLFYLGLSFSAVGTSFFKPNMTAVIGTFHDKNNLTDKAKSYTILQTVIHIGNVVAIISAGYVQFWLGWKYVFMISMVSSLSTLFLLYFYKSMFDHENFACKLDVNKKFFGLSIGNWFFLASCISGVLISFVFNFESSIFFFSLTSLIILLVYFAHLLHSTKEYRNLFGGLILLVFTSIFYTVQMTFVNISPLFMYRNSTNKLFGVYIPASVSQCWNPLFVVIFGLLSILLVRNRSFISRFRTFFVSICVIHCSFLIVYFGCVNATNYKVAYYYYLLAMMMTGLSEIFFTPFLLSCLTTLSPKKAESFLMNSSMMAVAASTFFVSKISQLASVPKEDIADAAQCLSIYQNTFWNMFVLFSVIIILFAPLLFVVKSACMRKQGKIEI